MPGETARARDVIVGFEVEQRLGHHAGVSTLYAARDLRHGRPVALRVLSGPSGRPDYGRVVAVRRSLGHRGLVPLVDAGRAPAGDWLASALVPGRSLARLLATERRLAPPRALDILAPVAGALDAAHELGFVCDSLGAHGIVVTVDADGRETGLLTDVGPAWPPTLRPGRLLGDVDGLSPEEIRGGSPTPAANVYALAALLVRCLTGEPPYAGPDAATVLYAHLAMPVPRPSGRAAGLPAALDDVIAAGLAKDPAARPARASELIADARRALGHGSARPASVPAPPAPRPLRRTAAGPTSTPAAPSRRRARRTVRAALVAVPAVVLLALGVLVSAGALSGNGAQRDTPALGATTGGPPGRAAATLTAPPAAAAAGASGRMIVAATAAGREFTISGRGLTATRPGESYVVWLFDSHGAALRLGAIVPGVGPGGTFTNHGRLPTAAARYARVVLTLEHAAGDRPAGPVVLEGPLRLPPGAG